MIRSAVLCLIFFLAASPLAQAADNEAFKESVRTTITDTVNASKDFFSGVMEGLDTTTRDGHSFDKNHIVSSKGDLQRLLKVEVVKFEDLEKGQYQITVALRNQNDFPVLVTNLSALGNVVLLDKDGFSYQLPNRAEQGRDLTALARSATRVRFNFTGVEARPATFRIFDTDVSIPRW